MASDQMDVDVPAPSLESLSPSSSFEKLDLKGVDLETLNVRMAEYCNELNLAMALQFPTNWQLLIVTILSWLTGELSETDIRQSIIVPVTVAGAKNLVKSFTDEELEEWKAGVRRGINSNNWNDLITHRTYFFDHQVSISFNTKPQQKSEDEKSGTWLWVSQLNSVCFTFPISFHCTHPARNLPLLRGW